MDHAEQLAREAIRKTLMVYTMRGDRGSIDELAAAFTDHGVLEIGADQRFEGRAGIARGLRETMSNFGTTGRATFMRHHVTSTEIEFESTSEARARAYFFVVTEIGPDHAGVYLDRLRSVGDEWLIAERRVRIDWVAENSVFPRERFRGILRPSA